MSTIKPNQSGKLRPDSLVFISSHLDIGDSTAISIYKSEHKIPDLDYKNIFHENISLLDNPNETDTCNSKYEILNQQIFDHRFRKYIDPICKAFAEFIETIPHAVRNNFSTHSLRDYSNISIQSSDGTINFRNIYHLIDKLAEILNQSYQEEVRPINYPRQVLGRCGALQYAINYNQLQDTFTIKALDPKLDVISDHIKDALHAETTLERKISCQQAILEIQAQLNINLYCLDSLSKLSQSGKQIDFSKKQFLVGTSDGTIILSITELLAIQNHLHAFEPCEYAYKPTPHTYIQLNGLNTFITQANELFEIASSIEQQNFTKLKDVAFSGSYNIHAMVFMVEFFRNLHYSEILNLTPRSFPGLGFCDPSSNTTFNSFTDLLKLFSKFYSHKEWLFETVENKMRDRNYEIIPFVFEDTNPVLGLASICEVVLGKHDPTSLRIAQNKHFFQIGDAYDIDPFVGEQASVENAKQMLAKMFISYFGGIPVTPPPAGHKFWLQLFGNQYEHQNSYSAYEICQIIANLTSSGDLLDSDLVVNIAFKELLLTDLSSINKTQWHPPIPIQVILKDDKLTTQNDDALLALLAEMQQNYLNLDEFLTANKSVMDLYNDKNVSLDEIECFHKALFTYVSSKISPIVDLFYALISFKNLTCVSTDSINEPIYGSNGKILFQSLAHLLIAISRAQTLKESTLSTFDIGKKFKNRRFYGQGVILSPLAILNKLYDPYAENKPKFTVTNPRSHADINAIGVSILSKRIKNNESFNDGDFVSAINILKSIVSQLSTENEVPLLSSIRELQIEDSNNRGEIICMSDVLTCIGTIGLNQNKKNKNLLKAYQYGLDLIKTINGHNVGKPSVNPKFPIEITTNQATIVALEALGKAYEHNNTTAELTALNDFLGTLSAAEQRNITTASYRYVRFCSIDRSITYIGLCELAKAAALSIKQLGYDNLSAGELLEDLCNIRANRSSRFDYHMPYSKDIIHIDPLTEIYSIKITKQNVAQFISILTEALRQHFGEGYTGFPELSNQFWSKKFKLTPNSLPFALTITAGEALSAILSITKASVDNIKELLNHSDETCSTFKPGYEHIIHCCHNRNILVRNVIHKRGSTAARRFGKICKIDNLDQLCDVIAALKEGNFDTLLLKKFKDEILLSSRDQQSEPDLNSLFKLLPVQTQDFIDHIDKLFIQIFTDIVNSIDEKRRYNIADPIYKHTIVSDAGWVKLNSFYEFIETYESWKNLKFALLNRKKHIVANKDKCKSDRPSPKKPQERTYIEIITELSTIAKLTDHKPNEKIIWLNDLELVHDPFTVSISTNKYDEPCLIVSSTYDEIKKSDIDSFQSQINAICASLWKEISLKNPDLKYSQFGKELSSTIKDHFEQYHKYPIFRIAHNIINLLPDKGRDSVTTGTFLGMQIYSIDGYILFKSFQELCREICFINHIETLGFGDIYQLLNLSYSRKPYSSDGLLCLVPNKNKRTKGVDVELSAISPDDLDRIKNSREVSKTALIRSMTEIILQIYGQIPSGHSYFQNFTWSNYKVKWINYDEVFNARKILDLLIETLARDDPYTKKESLVLRECRKYFRKHILPTTKKIPVSNSSNSIELKQSAAPLAAYLKESDGLLFKALVLLGWEKDSERNFREFKEKGLNSYRIAPKTEKSIAQIDLATEKSSPVKVYIEALQGSLIANKEIDLTELGIVAHEELLTELCRYHYDGDVTVLIQDLEQSLSFVDTNLPEDLRNKVEILLNSITHRVLDRFKAEQNIVIPKSIKKKPSAHQVSLIGDYYRGKKIIASEMGTGKTRVAAILCEMLHIDRALWIVKASGKIPTYDELLATVDLPKSKFVIIPSDAAGRKISEIKKLIGSAKYIIVANETLRTCLSENNSEMHRFLVTCQGDNGAIVIDEYHLFDNPESLRSQALEGLIGKHTIALSGSLYQNRAERIATLIHRLEPETYPDIKKLTERCKDPVFLRALIARHISVCFMNDIAGEFVPFSDIPAIEQLQSNLPLIPKVIKENSLRIAMSDERARMYVMIALFFERYATEHPKLVKLDQKISGDNPSELNNSILFRRFNYSSLRQVTLMQRALSDPEKLGLPPALEILTGVKQKIMPMLMSGKKILIFCQHKSLIRLFTQDADLKGFGLVCLDGTTNADERSNLRKEVENNSSIQVVIAQFDAEGTSSQIRGIDTVINVEFPSLFSTYKQSLRRVIRLISPEDAHLARDVVHQINVVQVLPESVLNDIPDLNIISTLGGTLSEARERKITQKEEIFSYIMRRATKEDAPDSITVEKYIKCLSKAVNDSTSKERIYDSLRRKIMSRYNNTIKNQWHQNQIQYIRSHISLIDPKNSNVLLLAGPYGLEMSVYDQTGFPRSNLHCIEGGSKLEREIFVETMSTSGTHSYLGRLGDLVEHLPLMGIISIDSDGPITDEYFEAFRKIKLHPESHIIIFKNSLSQRESPRSKLLLEAVSDNADTIEKRRNLLDLRLFNLLGTATSHEFGHLPGPEAIRIYSIARHVSRQIGRALSRCGLRYNFDEQMFTSYACSTFIGSAFIRDYRRFGYTSASNQPFSSVFAVLKAYKDEDRYSHLGLILRSLISLGIKYTLANRDRRIDDRFVATVLEGENVHFLAADNVIGTISQEELLAELNKYCLYITPIAPFRNDEFVSRID